MNTKAISQVPEHSVVRLGEFVGEITRHYNRGGGLGGWSTWLTGPGVTPPVMLLPDAQVEILVEPEQLADAYLRLLQDRSRLGRALDALVRWVTTLCHAVILALPNDQIASSARRFLELARRPVLPIDEISSLSRAQAGTRKDGCHV